MKKILSLILIITFSVALFAQVPPPPPDQGVNASGGPGSPVPEQPETPINGFLSFLLVAGMVMGVYFMTKDTKTKITD